MISGDYPQHVKQGVKNTKLPLDKALIWNQIEAKIRKRRKRRTLAFIPLVILLAVSISMFWSEQITRETMEKRKNSFNTHAKPLDNQTNASTFPCENIIKLLSISGMENKKPANSVPVIQKIKGRALSEKQFSGFLQPDLQKEMLAVRKDSVHGNHVKIESIGKIKSTQGFLPHEKIERTLHISPGPNSFRQCSAQPSFSLYAGIGYVNKRLSGQRGVSDEKIRQIRETETVLEQKMAGFSFTYPVHKNLFVSAGLDYRESTDKFQFSKVEKEEIDQLEFYQSYRVTETRLTRYNANRFLDVHIDVGYAMQLSGCKILPAIGLSYGLISAFEGTITSENNDPLYIKNTTLTPNIWNARFGTEVQFVLFPDMYLSITPLVVSGLNNFQRHEAGVYQTFNSYSLLVGIKKELK